jgi:hypothetical protein
MYVIYDNVRQSATSKSKSKKHGPITGSHRLGTGFIRASDWSMPLLCFCSQRFDALCDTIRRTFAPAAPIASAEGIDHIFVFI